MTKVLKNVVPTKQLKASRRYVPSVLEMDALVFIAVHGQQLTRVALILFISTAFNAQDSVP